MYCFLNEALTNYHSAPLVATRAQTPRADATVEGKKIFDSHYTAKRARPFALRAAITALPPLDFMRTKNPWVRFLLVTDGWYVRFIIFPYLFALKSARLQYVTRFLSSQFYTVDNFLA